MASRSRSAGSCRLGQGAGACPRALAEVARYPVATVLAQDLSGLSTARVSIHPSAYRGRRRVPRSTLSTMGDGLAVNDAGDLLAHL